MIDAQVVQELSTDNLGFVFAVILILLASQDLGVLVAVEAAA